MSNSTRQNSTRHRFPKGNLNPAKRPEVRQKISEAKLGARNPNYKEKLRICIVCGAVFDGHVRKGKTCSGPCLKRHMSENNGMKKPEVSHGVHAKLAEKRAAGELVHWMETDEGRARISAIAKARALTNNPMKNPEVSARVASANRGRPMPEAQKIKISASGRGRKCSEEHRRQVSLAKTGLVFSQETRHKISAMARARWHSRTPEDRIKYVRHLNSFVAKARPTSLERKVMECLDLLGVPYVFQYRVPPYVADFYISGYNLIIESDGSYWHRRARAMGREQVRDRYLENKGYNVAHVEEKKIRADVTVALIEVLSEAASV